MIGPARADEARVRTVLRHLVVAGALTATLVTPAPAGGQSAIPPRPDRAAPDYHEVAIDSWEVRGVATTANELTAAVPVWDMVEIDGVMYVGGQFLTVREGPGTPEESQPFLAAFDATTGVWIDSFRPALDGSVFAVARTRGGALLVGGEFTSVNGVPATAGLAALDPATGAVMDGWRASVTSAGPPMAVMDILVRRDHVYVAGNMTRITRPGSRPATVEQVARLHAATGAVDRRFRPHVNGGRVNVVATNRRGTRVYLGGYFTTVNGAPAAHFATVDAGTGALASVPQGLETTPSNGDPPAVFDIVATKRRVFVAGEFHHLHILDARTGRRTYSYVSAGFGGDYQAIRLTGGVLWLGGHFHGSEVPLVIDDTVPTRFRAFLKYVLRQPGLGQVQWAVPHDPATGHRLDGFVPRLEMSEGVWDIERSRSGMLWLAGDARRSQGRSVGGFAVFRLSTPDDEVDLAAGERASQSSTARCCGSDKRTGEARRAVDAKTAANFHETSSSLTALEADPWWQVDLGTSRQIDRLRVWPMTAFGALGASEPFPVPELRVFVSNRRFGSRDTVAEAAAMPGVQQHVITAVEDTGFVELPVDRRGRYIRVFGVGEVQLGLAEVEAIAGDPTLIATRATWQLTTEDPGSGWETAAFDHSTWTSGLAPIGREEPTEVNTQIPPGANTAYFFTEFTAADTATGTFELDLVRDDGAAVYLNGIEVARVNLPEGTLDHATAALEAISGDTERVAVTITVPAGVLVDGTNVVGVRLHNAAGSEDLRFSLRLRRAG